MPDTSKQTPLNMRVTIDFGTDTAFTSSRRERMPDEKATFLNYIRSNFPDIDSKQENALLENFQTIEDILRSESQKDPKFASRFLSNPDKALKQALKGKVSQGQKQFIRIWAKMGIQEPQTFPQKFVESVRLGDLVVSDSQRTSRFKK